MRLQYSPSDCTCILLFLQIKAVAVGIEVIKTVMNSSNGHDYADPIRVRACISKSKCGALIQRDPFPPACNSGYHDASITYPPIQMSVPNPRPRTDPLSTQNPSIAPRPNNHEHISCSIIKSHLHTLEQSITGHIEQDVELTGNMLPAI